MSMLASAWSIPERPVVIRGVRIPSVEMEPLCRGVLAEAQRRAGRALEHADYEAALGFLLSEAWIEWTYKYDPTQGVEWQSYCYGTLRNRLVDHARSWFGRRGQKRPLPARPEGPDGGDRLDEPVAPVEANAENDRFSDVLRALTGASGGRDGGERDQRGAGGALGGRADGGARTAVGAGDLTVNGSTSAANTVPDLLGAVATGTSSLPGPSQRGEVPDLRALPDEAGELPDPDDVTHFLEALGL